MTDQDKAKLMEQYQEEMEQKIKTGLLPPEAEIAICSTPNCSHWAHSLEDDYQGYNDRRRQ